MLELNSMALRKYVILLEARLIILEIHTGTEHSMNNRDCVEKFSVDFFLRIKSHASFHLKGLETIPILSSRQTEKMSART